MAISLFAIVAYWVFWPLSASMQQLAWLWMLQILAINIGAVVILAGAMHTYLYVVAGQDLRLKFDVRPMQKSTRFTFGDQVWDNMFWTLVSGVPIWSLWMILYFYMASNGSVPTLSTVAESPIWFILMFFVVRFWQSIHFAGMTAFMMEPMLLRNTSVPDGSASYRRSTQCTVTFKRYK